MNRKASTNRHRLRQRIAQTVLSPRRATRRPAKILVLFAMLLPVLVGVAGLVVDGGLLTAHQRHLQHAVDAAAAAAAMDLLQGETVRRAAHTAKQYVQRQDNLARARVQFHHPPHEGRYAGDDRYVQLAASRDAKTYLVHVLGGPSVRTVKATAVAGFEPSTDLAAITVLSPTPNGRVAGLSFVAGGTVRIDGAVLVNTESGAVDEDGHPAGRSAGPPYGVQSTRGTIVASDLRVAGGVDDPRPYRQADLRANQLPVEDPLQQLRPPTLRRSGRGRGDNDYGGVEIPSGRGNSSRAARSETLHPGSYDYVQVTSGRVTFRPGIYIIRGVHPRTRIALNLQSNQLTARGVLFYIDAASKPSWPGDRDRDFTKRRDDDFSASSSASFVADGSTPSVIVNVGAQSQFSPLQDSTSAYDGMLLFQNQDDRRSIQINYRSNRANRFAGVVYAKSGHVHLVAQGTCQASFVVGTMRISSASGCRLQPLRLQPPADDVYLVE